MDFGAPTLESKAFHLLLALVDNASWKHFFLLNLRLVGSIFCEM